MNTHATSPEIWPPEWALKEALEFACQALSAGRQRHSIPEVSAAIAKLETELRERLPEDQPAPEAK